MKKFFSIIVPVYNVENQLKLCVESIVGQSYNDLEILLIDDGSTDNSGVICDELAKCYTNVVCYHKANGGLSDARNYGMERATGKYLLFIDSDDVIDKDFCKILHDAHEKHGADIVSLDIVSFYSYDELCTLIEKEYEFKEIVLMNEEIIKAYYMPTKNMIINHGLCMKSYKAELFNDLRFECGKLHEDLYITYQLLDKCKKFVYVDLPYYYYYRSNEGSITNNYRSKNYEDETNALNNMINYFENRQDVKNELIYFITHHYLHLIRMCYKLPNSIDVLNSNKTVSIWLSRNIWKCNKLDWIRKIFFYVCIKFPRLYNWIKG